MNREQEIRQRYVREFVGSDMQWADTVARDVAWLLSELARLRTEAHQMQEAPPDALENAKQWLVDYVRHNFRPRFDIEQRDEDDLYETLMDCYVEDVVREASLVRAGAVGPAGHGGTPE